jgi:spermidine synthase
LFPVQAGCREKWSLRAWLAYDTGFSNHYLPRVSVSGKIPKHGWLGRRNSANGNPMIILFFFFWSGATALVYEVIWSKYLALLVGSTIQAQTLVLAVFMSGLALGNWLFGRQADRAARPLIIYGLIEVVIGLYALLFPLIYQLTGAAFVFAGSRLLDHSAWLLVVKGIFSAALLIGPTILMGGTLPVLAAWLQQSTTDAARRSARFYSTNSLGAVGGAWLAGFVLVPWLGMGATVETTALVNVLIGISVIGIGRSQLVRRTAAGPGPEAMASSPLPSRATPAIFRWGCVLVALTGAVSLGLEVLASRCLCLIFGASLQVFAIVLIAFILGIGLGSAVIASPRRRHWPKETTTLALLLGTAVFIGLLVFNIENLVHLYVYAQSGLTRTPVGYQYHQIMLLLISIGVLGLPAAALGSVLPLWIRMVSETSDPLGERVGRLLTWNTLGAMTGALVTGFLLLPQIGLRGSFTVLAATLTVAALLAAFATRQRIAAVASVVIGAILILISSRGGEDWRYVLSSGIFREQNVNFASFMRARRESVKLVFYEDAADATVSVESSPSIFSAHELGLRINGKVDASSGGDLSTQYLLGLLPLMARPYSRDVFCFGMGSGITAGTTLDYPIEHLTVAENCAPVLQAAGLFAPFNKGVLTNSRVHIYDEDARTVLKLNPQKYDVIISEPSNPWMAGIGSVFSREFYELAASRLKPGGIMTQWFHTYEMDDDLVNLVLRTFRTVFPDMEIWDCGEGDIVLLGSVQPWQSGLAVYQRAFQLTGPGRDLSLIGLNTPEAVLARQLASQRTAFAVAGPGRIQSDDLPVLEYAAPRTFYLRKGAQGLEHFDERTWQADLAARDKIQSLKQLGLPALNSIFGQYQSVNTELQAYVHMRLTGASGSAEYPLLAIPCVFRGTNQTMVFAPESVQTNQILRELVGAEFALRSDTANPAQIVQGMKQILDLARPGELNDPNRSAAYYADLAVKAGLDLGNTNQAKAILLRGLQLEPDSDQLRYLSRILIHRGILQPTEVPQ